MKRYLSISKGFILNAMSFRLSFIFAFISNMIFMVLIYFLWKAIYASAGTPLISGMDFNDTFIYLTLASSMFAFFRTFTDWYMSNMMMKGDIVTIFLRPIDYQLYVFFESIGDVITNSITIFIPSVFMIVFVFHARINLGANIIFFVLSIGFAYIISFSFDFFIGLTSFYTESVWGISMTKDVVIMLLSGGVIPLAFFPEALRKVMEFLPFQAIYNVPISILTNKTYTIDNYIGMIGIQIVWVLILIIINRLYFSQASKVITVNGG